MGTRRLPATAGLKTIIAGEIDVLILTRKIGEGIVIGEDIRVVVLEIRGKQIRLGIEAPVATVILREELFQRMAEENVQAATFQSNDVKEVVRVWKQRKEEDERCPEDPPV